MTTLHEAMLICTFTGQKDPKSGNIVARSSWRIKQCLIEPMDYWHLTPPWTATSTFPSIGRAGKDGTSSGGDMMKPGMSRQCGVPYLAMPLSLA